MPRIKVVTQPVTQKIETQEDQREQRSRDEQHPRRALHLRNAYVDERAERCLRLLYTEPEETQERLDKDGLRNGQRHVHNNDADGTTSDGSSTSDSGSTGGGTGPGNGGNFWNSGGTEGEGIL